MSNEAIIAMLNGQINKMRSIVIELTANNEFLKIENEKLKLEIESLKEKKKKK